jgi:hypothetical protein
MPEGQFLGVRENYIYEGDGGAKYIVTTDSTLGGLPGTGLEVATSANAADAQPAPKRFEPRVVFWQAELDGRMVRKAIVCGDVTADLYAKDTSQALAIDGVTGSTTGRKGEKLSFLRLSAGDDTDPGAPGAPDPVTGGAING